MIFPQPATGITTIKENVRNGNNKDGNSSKSCRKHSDVKSPQRHFFAGL